MVGMENPPGGEGALEDRLLEAAGRAAVTGVLVGDPGGAEGAGEGVFGAAAEGGDDGCDGEGDLALGGEDAAAVHLAGAGGVELKARGDRHPSPLQARQVLVAGVLVNGE